MLALSAAQPAHMCAVSNHDCNRNETLAMPCHACHAVGLVVIDVLEQGHVHNCSILQAAEANAISCLGGLAFGNAHLKVQADSM